MGPERESASPSLEASELYPRTSSRITRAEVLSHGNTRTIDQSHEIYLASLSQRQQRQQQPLPTSNYPRPPPSSSSGSTRTLRRTPKFDRRDNSDTHPVVGEQDAPDSPTAQPQPARALGEEGDGSTTPRATRIAPQEEPAFWPRRTNRISRRTASAILFALEEAIRTPYPFTPVLAEENASMADLGGEGLPVSNGRPQNGSARTAAGSIPVPQKPSERVRTPTQIMQERRDREARKRAESEREKEQEIAAQRRAASAAAGDAPSSAGAREQKYRTTQAPQGNQISGGENVPPDDGSRKQRDRVSRGSIPAAVNLPPSSKTQANPPSGTTQGGQSSGASRAQGPDTSSALPTTGTKRRSQSQGQAAPVQAPAPRVISQPLPRTQQTSSVTANTQSRADPTAGTSANRPQNPQGPAPTQQQRTTGTQGTGSGSQQRSTGISSFPHAFERWEQLSSHWEGLTSFWIRRLEQNKEEIDKNPLNSQLARQVNDLSAAGANLFHAVVELQRLRASSERKFQRWYFETRDDSEKGREKVAGLEEALRQERSAKADAIAALTRVETDKNSAYQNRSTAEQMVKEMRRELQISKEEARRAWEELGRREQEERDRTLSLRNGQPTLVGGVQVVPMIQGATSGQGSANRPSTREGPQQNRPGPESVESPVQGDPGYTTYDAARSETDTDPFTEGGRVRTGQTAVRLPTMVPQIQQTSNASAAALQAAQSATYQAGSGANPGATPSSQGGTYLRYGPAAAGQPASSFYQHEGSALLSEGQQARMTEADERSYVPSVPDTSSQEEYEMNSNGEVQRDDQGRPIPYTGDLGSDDSDEYDVQDQLERERMYGQHYGSGFSGVEYGSGSTITTGAPQPADYSGSGYGAAPGWEAVPRHHHPTRLSDVLEEDERTNRTSPSRASQR
ncbi:MAG: hypothetical protein LQ343_000586 [Gyalolechia ehrenbergii]|nr:MAG: hypothetical protein LQ343_000586 [Gyalolechia ehrenbergii]